MDIHGAATVPYGLTTQEARRPDDAVEDICRQVLYHEQLARDQLARLGAERFMIVHYEDICGDPRGFVETAGRVFLGTIAGFRGDRPDPQVICRRPSGR